MGSGEVGEGGGGSVRGLLTDADLQTGAYYKRGE